MHYRTHKTLTFQNDSIEAWAVVRFYREASHYEGDQEITDWFELVREDRIRPEEFVEYIQSDKNPNYLADEEVANLVKIFPKPKD